MNTQALSNDVQLNDERDIQSEDSLRKIIRLHSDQCAEFIRESPNDYLGRVRILRRVTVGLFATSVLLSVVLNATFVILHSTLQEMLIGNASVLLLFILSAISFLNDRSLQPFREDALIGQVRQRLELVLSQIHDLQKLKSAMIRGNEKLLNQQQTLDLQVVEKEADLQECTEAIYRINNQIKDLTSQLNSKQAEWDTLSEQCQVREAESLGILIKTQEEIAAAEANLKQCNELLSQVKSSLHATESTKHDQEQAVSQLATELRLARQDLDNIHSQRSIEEERLNITQAELQLAMASLAESRATIDWMKTEVDSVQEQLSFARSELTAVCEEKLTLESDSSKLEAKIEDQKIELMHLHNEEIRIKTDVERREISRQEIAHQLQDISFEIDCERQKLNAIRNELSQALELRHQYLDCESFETSPIENVRTNSIDDANQIQVELIGQLLWLQGEIKLLQAEQTLLSSEVHDLEQARREKDAITSELQELQSRFTQLQEDVIRVEGERSQFLMLSEQLSSDNQALKSCLDEMQDLTESLRTESDRLNDTLLNQRNDIDLAKAELESIHRQRTELELNNAKATSSLESLLDSIEDLHRRELELNETISSLQSQFEQATQANQTAEHRSQLVQARLNALSEEKQHLENEIASLQLKEKSLSDGIEIFEREKIQLVKMNEDLKMNLADKNNQLNNVEVALRNAEQSLQDTLNSIIQKENLLATINEEHAILQGESKHLQTQIEQRRNALKLLENSKLEREQENDSLKHSNEELSAMIQDRTAQVKSLDAKIQDAIEEKRAVDRSIESQKQQLQELQIQADALDSVSFELNLQQQRLRELQAETARNETAIRDQQSKSQQLNEEVYVATTLKCGLQKDCDDLQIALASLKTNIEETKLEELNLQKAAQASQAKLNELQKNVENWTEEAKQRQAERVKLLRELECISKDVAESQKVCEEWQNYKLKLQKDNQDLQQNKLDVQQAIKLATDEHSRINKDCRVLQEEQAQLQKKNLDLQTSIEDAYSTLRGVQMQEADVRSMIQSLEQDVKQLSLDLKNSTQEVQREQDKLVTLNQEKNRLRSELEVTQQSVDGLCAEIAELKDERDTLRLESEQFTSSLVSLKQKYEDTQIQLANSERVKSELQSETHDLERKCKSLASLIDDRQSQCDAMESKLSRMHDAMAAVETTHQKLIHDRDSLQRMVESYQKTSDDLTLQINNCETEYEAKKTQLSKLAAEEAKLNLSILGQQETSSGLEKLICTKQDELRLLESHFNATIAEQTSQLTKLQNEVELAQQSVRSLVAEYDSLQQSMKHAVTVREAFSSEVDSTLNHTKQSLSELLQTFQSQFDELEMRSTRVEDSQAALSDTVKETEIAQAELKKLLGTKMDLATEVDALLVELRSINEEVEQALQRRAELKEAEIPQQKQTERVESIKESAIVFTLEEADDTEPISYMAEAADTVVDEEVLEVAVSEDAVWAPPAEKPTAEIDAWSITEISSRSVSPLRDEAKTNDDLPTNNDARHKNDLWSTVF